MGTRGQLLVWCAIVWALVGLGVALGLGSQDPSLPHTALPLVIRVGGWWVSAALAVYGVVRRRHLPLVIGALMVMPLQRLASYLWAWVMHVVPGPPPGVPHGWYEGAYYLLMVGIVLITALVREPDAKADKTGGGA